MVLRIFGFRSILVFVFVLIDIFCFAAEVQIAVSSEWAHEALRAHLRNAFKSCVPEAWKAEQLFFMGDADDNGRRTAEMAAFDDVVVVHGPDALDESWPDPLTHSTEPHLMLSPWPTSRARRWLRSLVWLLEHRPDFLYVAQIDDRVILYLPGMIARIRENANASLAMSRISRASLNLGGSATDFEAQQIVDTSETALGNTDHTRLCIDRIRKVPFGLEMRGCLATLQRCCETEVIEGRDHQCNDLRRLDACLVDAHTAGVGAATYFGAAYTPRLLHESFWVVGRRVAEFLGENADDLKKRGAAGLLLGFWLTAIEDVHFVDLGRDLVLPHEASALKTSDPAQCSNIDIRPLAVVGSSADADGRAWPTWMREDTCEFELC
eukprot:TRINITY_DN31089_c0_g1_i1.p1 TRINITY_DN31089_c0_g1~~TRINITY_DN31089_c0_g1_i1.p1  ORF type:complete len:380 (+),score=53.24 TRINITY_DN31089_c0_g1_i1:33-1172(+)